MIFPGPGPVRLGADADANTVRLRLIWSFRAAIPLRRRAQLAPVPEVSSITHIVVLSSESSETNTRRCCFPSRPLLQVAYTVSSLVLVNKAETQLLRAASYSSSLTACLMIAGSHVQGVLYHSCFSNSGRAEGVAAHRGFRVHYCGSGRRIGCIRARRVFRPSS